MTRIDQTQGECWVFTFKEGLLSAVAHDLKIRVARWHVTYDVAAGTVSGSWDAASLEVVCARRDGRDAHGTISDRDKRKITKNIASDVLKPRRNPTITFRSTSVTADGDGWKVAGDLTLAGRTRSIRAAVVRDGDRLTTEVRLHQPDFGIKPYTAMLGTLRIQPDVVVQLSVPAP